MVVGRWWWADGGGEMVVRRWGWADGGWDMGVGRWECLDGSGPIGVGRYTFLAYILHIHKYIHVNCKLYMYLHI